MRTTLTLEDDVAIEIERRRRNRGTSLKREVNDLLRAGLARREVPDPAAGPFRTPALDIGRPLIDNIDDVDGTLDAVNGSWRR